MGLFDTQRVTATAGDVVLLAGERAPSGTNSARG
jgi:hypothetical protein